MSRPVNLCVGLIAALAVVGLVGWGVAEPPAADWPWAGAMLVLAVCAGLESRAVPMPGGNTVSIATIPHLAGVFLLPPPLALFAGAAGMLIDMLRLREPASRVIFNTANTLVTMGVTALTAQLLDVRGPHLVDGGLADVGRFLLVAASYYVTNNLLLAGIMAVSGQRQLRCVLWENARASAPPEFAVAVIGGLAVFVWLTNAAWLPLVVFPILVAQLTLEYLAANNRKTAELQHQALYDALTGLPNRTSLQQQLQAGLGRTARDRGKLALLLLDLDGFKEVNDTFGHLHGDILLREVGRRLTERVGQRGSPARLGGDEFAVLLPGADEAEANAVAGAWLEALARPLQVEGVELFVGCSIGVALAPDHGHDPETLLRRADVAMYAAKRHHEGVVVYRPELDSNDRDRLMLLHDLRTALDQGELTLAYQPKVCAATGRLHSVEALVRWTHPTRGPISPAVFVPLAEQAGLSHMLALWVLNTALQQCRAWQDQGWRIPVCINISMYELRDPALPELVAEQLKAHGVDAGLLGIEVTESAAMADPSRTRAVLDALRRLGARVSIDDFGTGYSSLAYLTSLPVDELKIDRSFVVGMHDSVQHDAIVRSTISLGHDLGLSVVAEGVEDERTAERLRVFGCDLIQGYLVARPLAAGALLTWVSGRKPLSSLIAA
jgi:diguanylate cyclase (GGDEF)-like protein